MSFLLIFGLLSPTLFLAVFLKKGTNKKKVIRSLNWIYFGVAVLSVIFMIVHYNVMKYNSEYKPLTTDHWFACVWVVFLISRCSEIFYAFMKDALDKISNDNAKDIGSAPGLVKLIDGVLNIAKLSEGKKTDFYDFFRKVLEGKNKFLSSIKFKERISGRDIKNADRLILSFRSYFELIINFAIIYSLVNGIHWGEGKPSLNIIDALYFSGVTITTLGYGDISPEHWFSQFLAVFEVLCGFSLIVVCFAVYLKDDQ